MWLPKAARTVWSGDYSLTGVSWDGMDTVWDVSVLFSTRRMGENYLWDSARSTSSVILFKISQGFFGAVDFLNDILRNVVLAKFFSPLPRRKVRLDRVVHHRATARGSAQQILFCWSDWWRWGIFAPSLQPPNVGASAGLAVARAGVFVDTKDSDWESGIKSWRRQATVNSTSNILKGTCRLTIFFLASKIGDIQRKIEYDFHSSFQIQSK